MGTLKKATVAFLGLVAVGGIAKQFPAKPALKRTSPEDRCEARIVPHLPDGAFVVMHTPPDATGRSEWIIDHGGMREAVVCTVRPDSSVALTVGGHD